MAHFDVSKARLRGKPMFQPYRVPKQGADLAKAKLKPTEELILMERNNTVKTFSVKQMAYHHIAQGDIAGEPYLVSF